MTDLHYECLSSGEAKNDRELTPGIGRQSCRELECSSGNDCSKPGRMYGVGRIWRLNVRIFEYVEDGTMSTPVPVYSGVQPIRVSLTNVAGLGATQLVRSLLPHLEEVPGFQIEEIYLPNRGELCQYRRKVAGIAPTVYRRLIPNSLSRVLECTLFGYLFSGTTPILVLGDLPIRCKTRQVVFVQSPHVIRGTMRIGGASAFKYLFARAIFRLNLRYVAAFIVQTQSIKAALAAGYPGIDEKIHVISQPPPSWLLKSGMRRVGRDPKGDACLHLFYPAACYPHKNHRLLGTIDAAGVDNWGNVQLALTIPEDRNPNVNISWIKCVGRLSPREMLSFYEKADALLFLSLAESYGLPLVEAMWVGLPIICPDLPYARALCGDRAIYFNPKSVESLRLAVSDLRERLALGWWPDWTDRLRAIPKGWDEVAGMMLQITGLHDRHPACQRQSL